MKKVGQLMKDLGFNESGSDAAKEAFIKYLLKQSTGVDVQTPAEKKLIKENPEKIVRFPQQLGFSFLEDELLQDKKKA